MLQIETLMRSTCQRTVWVALVAAVWLAAASSGLWMLWRWDNASGAAANAPARWPTTSRLKRVDERPTLILMAHPQCSCTSASLAELAEVLARAKSQPTTYVVFLKPEGVSPDWIEGDLWRTATGLPRVTVLRDEDGTEALRFGAATSGQTFLYDSRGTLVFSGGITAARAHAGDNVGRRTILTALDGDASSREPSTSVFGCPLFNSQS
jgi:hypothetical protein